jgi:hypothetical protein
MPRCSARTGPLPPSALRPLCVRWHPCRRESRVNRAPVFPPFQPPSGLQSLQPPHAAAANARPQHTPPGKAWESGTRRCCANTQPAATRGPCLRCRRPRAAKRRVGRARSAATRSRMRGAVHTCAHACIRAEVCSVRGAAGRGDADRSQPSALRARGAMGGLRLHSKRDPRSGVCLGMGAGCVKNEDRASGRFGSLTLLLLLRRGAARSRRGAHPHRRAPRGPRRPRALASVRGNARRRVSTAPRRGGQGRGYLDCVWTVPAGPLPRGGAPRLPPRQQPLEAPLDFVRHAACRRLLRVRVGVQQAARPDQEVDDIGPGLCVVCWWVREVIERLLARRGRCIVAGSFRGC